jgi:hypothetical protein
MADQSIVQNFAIVPAGDVFDNYEIRVYAYQHVAHIYDLVGHDYPDPAQMRYHAFLLVRVTRTPISPLDQYELHFGDCRLVHKGRLGELPYWLAPEWSGNCVIDPRKGLKSVSMSYLPKDLEFSMGWHDHRAWSIVFRRRDLERGGVAHLSFRTFVNGLRKRMEPIALKFPARICENLALEYSKL